MDFIQSIVDWIENLFFPKEIKNTQNNTQKNIKNNTHRNTQKYINKNTNKIINKNTQKNIINKPNSTSEIKGASIIIWYKEESDIFILTGRESRYLRNRTRLFPDKTVITQHESFKINNSKLNNKMKANNFFKEKAIHLEKLYFNALGRNNSLKHEVRFYNPIVSNNSVKAVFRYSNNNCSYGIIKGQKESFEKNSLETIIRETEEEVGFKLYENKIKKIESTNSDYALYHYKVTQEEREEILQIINKRKLDKRGELFDLKFQKIDDSFREQLKSPKWNKKSIFLINTFLSLNLT
jgi:hypothetical protein